MLLRVQRSHRRKAAGAIVSIQHARDQVFLKFAPADCKLQQKPDVLVKIYNISDILVTRLKNGVRKNADGGLYNRASGTATMSPGVMVNADSLKKSRRDINLSKLSNSDLAVTYL